MCDGLPFCLECEFEPAYSLHCVLMQRRVCCVLSSQQVRFSQTLTHSMSAVQIGAVETHTLAYSNYSMQQLVAATGPQGRVRAQIMFF